MELVLVSVRRVRRSLPNINTRDSFAMGRVLGLDMAVESIHDIKVSFHRPNSYDLAVERSSHHSNLVFLIVVRHHKQLLRVEVFKLLGLVSLKSFSSDYLG